MNVPVTGAAPLRVGLVCPMPQERWFSIELAAEMLVAEFRAHHWGELRAETIRPGMARRLGAVPGLGGRRAALNADRLLNRFWDYPRRLRRVAGAYDLFHLVEHSYGQLARVLPPRRTVVTCHDLDTFRPVLEPARDPRPAWYRAMVERQMTALRTAARVICVSQAVASELDGFGVVPRGRVRVVPNGIDAACSPAPDSVADAAAATLLGPARADEPELLHVGSTVARKRIDVLLRVLASVRTRLPGARLVRVGGELEPEQAALATALGVGGGVVSLPFLDRATLAAVYRRAALVLQPSEAEGFGLPVAEGLACGTPVVASDLTVLREVAGPAAEYRPVGDVAAWSEAVLGLLAERRADPPRWAARQAASAARGGSFSWRAHAAGVARVYREVAGGAVPG